MLNNLVINHDFPISLVNISHESSVVTLRIPLSASTFWSSSRQYPVRKCTSQLIFAAVSSILPHGAIKKLCCPSPKNLSSFVLLLAKNWLSSIFYTIWKLMMVWLYENFPVNNIINTHWSQLVQVDVMDLYVWRAPPAALSATSFGGLVQPF